MNPFFSIWAQPSKTIRYIVEHKSIFYPLMLIPFLLSQAASWHLQTQVIY